MATYYRGSTIDISLTVEDTDGVAVDLTGATVKFRLAQRLGANAAYEETMTLGATTGTASHTISAASSLTLNGGYVYTVHVTEADSNVFIAAQGTLTFTNIVLAT
jgi:hypothetical protein